MLVNDVIKRLRFLPLILVLFLTGYFSWHGYYGRRGYKRWRELKAEYQEALAEKQGLNAEKNRLALRVSQMYAPNIDRDLLDEAARRILNYSEKDDVIIFD